MNVNKCQFTIDDNLNLIRDYERVFLSNPHYMSGILNWALEGLIRLLTSNKFSGDQRWDRVRDRWQKISEPVSKFIFDKDWIILADGEQTLKSKLYDHFVGWCGFNQMAAITSAKFYRDMKRLYVRDGFTGLLQDCRMMDGDKESYGYKGIRVRYPEIEQTAEPY